MISEALVLSLFRWIFFRRGLSFLSRISRNIDLASGSGSLFINVGKSIVLVFVKDHENFVVHLPILQIMIGTGLRCGELIGLTRKDVDMKKRTVSVNPQLTYKNYGDGCNFRKTLLKTKAGARVIPMS